MNGSLELAIKIVRVFPTTKVGEQATALPTVRLQKPKPGQNKSWDFVRVREVVSCRSYMVRAQHIPKKHILCH